MSKVVVVMGAAGGIGRAIAETFAKHSDFCSHMVLLDHENKKRELDEITQFVRQFIRVAWSAIDLTEIKSTELFGRYLRFLGGDMNVLINAAGVLPVPSPLVKTDEETIEKTLAVNLRGTMNCCKAVLPIMRAQKYGRIVNISSIAAQSGDPGNTAYAISKAAVEKLTKQLAIEASYNKDGEPFDITVNAVAPGIVDTPMTANLHEKALQEYFKRSPLKRKIKPEEVPEAVYFLATASQAINGVILPVDGGYLAS